MAIYWAEAPRRALIAITATVFALSVLCNVKGRRGRVFVCVRYPLVIENTLRPFFALDKNEHSGPRPILAMECNDPDPHGTFRWLERNHCSRILWTASCVPVFCTGLEAVNGNSWQKPRFSTIFRNDLYFIVIFIQCTTNRRGSKINCWCAKVQKNCWQAYALLCN